MSTDTQPTQTDALDPVDFMVNMGPQHPSTHGVFRMVLWIDGERIVKVEPHIGYLHRGSEKLCEIEDYSQIVTLFDRIDYIGNLNSELAFCMAVEKIWIWRFPNALGTSAPSSASSTASPTTCSSTGSSDWTPAP